MHQFEMWQCKITWTGFVLDFREFVCTIFREELCELLLVCVYLSQLCMMCWNGNKEINILASCSLWDEAALERWKNSWSKALTSGEIVSGNAPSKIVIFAGLDSWMIAGLLNCDDGLCSDYSKWTCAFYSNRTKCFVPENGLINTMASHDSN